MRIAREVALYNQGSIENGIDDASKVATSFITFVSSAEGIKVHNADDLSDYIQVNSNAISMHRGNTEKMKLTDSSLRLGDTNNNAYIDTDGMKVYQDGNISASFGSTGARIGKGDEARLELDYGSMQLVDKDGNPFFRVFDLNDAQGRYEKTEQYTGYHMQVVIGGVTYYAVGLDEYAESVISVTVNGVPKVSPTDYILYTQQSYGTSLICFTYNIGTTATVVVRYYVDSDALKAYTIGTRATGDVGLFSVAEGYEIVASGKHSHAQNINTIASGFAQTAIGRYNNNKINTAFEIGNGSSDSSRSNAFTVDWSGNVRINGDLYVGCNADSSGGTPIGYVLDTDGSWSWKKYTDGTFEMWRHYGGAPATGSHYTTINGFYGYYVSGFSFPSSCKPTNANYFVKTSWSIGNGFALDATGYSKTATGFSIFALATASNQTTVTADIYVVGRWK